MKWLFWALSLAIFVLISALIILSCAEEFAEEPLEIIWTMPPNGYDGMPEPIKIQFNHIIEAATISNAITISPSLGELDRRSSSWIDGNTYLVAFAEPPEPGKKYTVTVSPLVKDRYGNSLSLPYTFSFTYRFGIEYTWPESGEKDTSPIRGIGITFSYPIDVEACRTAFSISPSVEGRFSPSYVYYIGRTTRLDFEPFKSLMPSTEYTVTINKNAKARNGEPLTEPYIFSFTTERFRVRDTFPEDGKKDVSLSVNYISITFNASLDMESCQSAFSISPPVKGKFNSYYSIYYGVKLYFYPSEPLAPFTKYTVTINTSAKANNGESLAEPYTFSFTTGEKED
ncbi:TPA: hypothetical protein EYP70_00925 [Candidatus Bathyarchaeota archaeon]|nr:hypothetical protein [Candidatus Bathyarchaeota archaeon]